MARTDRRALDRLYRKIPQFSCGQTGCNDCCGPLAVLHPIEHEKAPLLAAAVDRFLADGCVDCPYSKNGCTVYDNRPFMCRLFGVVDDPRLLCPHGYRPRKLLSSEQGERLTMEYIDLIKMASV